MITIHLNRFSFLDRLIYLSFNLQLRCRSHQPLGELLHYHMIGIRFVLALHLIRNLLRCLISNLSVFRDYFNKHQINNNAEHGLFQITSLRWNYKDYAVQIKPFITMILSPSYPFCSSLISIVNPLR